MMTKLIYTKFFLLAQLLFLPFAFSLENKVQTILIGIDGLSYASFLEAQRQGFLQEFTQLGAHVAPFPSMTDLSWSQVTQTSELFGSVGRIKSVEATYFDDSTQSIQGDPRDYYRRLSFPKYYMGAFDFFFNPYVEALMYFPTTEVPKLEIKSVIDDLISAKQKSILTGYIGAIDSTSHTQKNRLYEVIRILDSEIKRLITSYREKNQEIEVILVSDHGNYGRFNEGTKDEIELLPVNLKKSIEAAGFQFVQQLKNEKDVGVPLMALGSWGPVYLKDRRKMKELLEHLRTEKWFDLAISINKNSQTETHISVISNQGEAYLKYDKKNEKIYYYNLKGNVLFIPEFYHANLNTQKFITKNEALSITANTPYPDSLWRIVESTSSNNFDFPDFILSLKDGYYLQSSLGAFTKMYRTHGSLSANSSFGILASNRRKIPGQIRSKEILHFLNINPKDLFGKTYQKSQQKDSSSLSELMKNSPVGIETQAKDFSQKRIFQYISRFVTETRPYFVVSEMKNFMSAFKFDPSKSPESQFLSPLNFNISKFDIQSMISPEDIGALTDAILTSGSAEKLASHSKVQQIKKKVGLLQKTKESNLSTFSGMTLPAKQAVMKMYQIPYLLEKSFVIQEKPFVPDPHDFKFAKDWLSLKTSAIKNSQILNQTFGSYPATNLAANLATNPLGKETLVQKLLQETIKEADLEDKIYPTPLTKIYNEKLKDVTIVYLSGIYNSIFDKEIFSLGLNALSDELGLRVIQPPIESLCASDYNSEIITQFLKDDSNSRQQKGFAPPKYLFLGYSKGGIDALHFILKNTKFTSESILGLVTIASPLHGSSILDSTDLPFSLVTALSGSKSPEICQNDKIASKSVTPSAMAAFWRKNERALVGLTRYFSITFESLPEDSHIFMKATKLLARFDENNDGVVTTSSSKFPNSLQATDLGTLNADHLAGILSSHFNQKAFMKGLLQTLAELKIDDLKNNFKWNANTMIQLANGEKWKNKRYFKLGDDNSVTKIDVQGDKYILTAPFASLRDLNQLLLPLNSDPADDYLVKTNFPKSQISYNPYNSLDITSLDSLFSKFRISPADKKIFPHGIQIEFKNRHMIHFRMENQFYFDSSSPSGLDDNKEFGFFPTDFNGEKNWLALRSHKNSIKMMTLSYRFSPLEFPNIDLKMAVTKGVNGADPVKGKTGKDDSAFQIWFMIRDGKANNDLTILDGKNDKVFLFGYYWGDPVPGEERREGDIFENWYSHKSYGFITLPESKQLLLNNTSMLGKVQNFKRNFVADLKKAFPNKNVNEFEILAIIFQHDSNDTKDSSEAYFKHLKFLP